MTMAVLHEKQEIVLSRYQLIKKGVSCIASPWQSMLHRIGLSSTVPVGDVIKSWDVLATLEFIESHIEKKAAILDIGCYASEILVALHKLGYQRLTGADLNPRLKQMPYQDAIRYEVTDFMHTNFADASFKAITAISVIEHGYQPEALLKEVSRLLQSGGYFIASFDYWPEKIDTTGVKFFDMDWLIFSKHDVATFVTQAAAYELVPDGEMQYAAKDKTIDCGGKQYTFAWLVFRKT